MHSRWTRPYELTHQRPRRILNLTQKDPGGAVFDVASSNPVAANQVLCGFVYSHMSAGGGADFVGLGIDPTFRTQTFLNQPDLQTPIAQPYGNGLQGDMWRNHDKLMNHTLTRQQSPLGNAPGYLEHIWNGSTFNGSSSTTALRDAQPSDIIPYPNLPPDPTAGPPKTNPRPHSQRPTVPTPRPPTQPGAITTPSPTFTASLERTYAERTGGGAPNIFVRR